MNVNTLPPLKFECKLRFNRAAKGKKELTIARPEEEPVLPNGRVPRISKLMALAIRFDELLRNGDVEDFADLARLGHVTRARVTQIMNLLNLAPDIQEDLLFLPRVESGRDSITEGHLRPIAAERSWASQRCLWKAAKRRATAAVNRHEQVRRR
jgi:hypothetical protein